MVYICKDFCRSGVYCFKDMTEIHGFKKAMINIKPSLAYMIANRCGTCSESKESVWYLKWVSTCPCCGSSLRRKSKHSIGRQNITTHINKQKITEYIKNS